GGLDGICSIEYGRCDRVFDTLDECLAAGFDCHVGANEETQPVCAVQWNASERPTFTEERCETMGGVVGDSDSNLWINMSDSSQSCLVLTGPTTAECEAVDG